MFLMITNGVILIINNEKNNKLYQKYKELADKDVKVIFGGRLGQYQYYDMDKVILEALNCVKQELKTS